MEYETDDDDEEVCPVCGLDNKCTKDEDCWCVKHDIKEIQHSFGKCLCEDCFTAEDESNGC